MRLHKNSIVFPTWMTFLLIFLLTISFHGHSQTIYGINTISHVKPSATPPFYIQVGAYKNKDSAQRISQSFNGSYPVRIVQHGSMHAVIIGPIPSYAALKEFANKDVAAPVPVHRFLAKKKPLQVKEKPLQIKKKKKKNMPVIHKQRTQAYDNYEQWMGLPGSKYKAPAVVYHKKIRTVRHLPPEAVVDGIPRRNPSTGSRSEWIGPQFTKEHSHSLLIKLDIGAISPTFVNTMYVNNGSNFLSPSDMDIYTTKQSTQPTAALTVSKQFGLNFSAIRSLALGLRYQYLIPQNVGGTITQYSLPQFLNYNYNLDASAQVLTFESKINSVDYSSFSPYMNIGLGASLAQVSGYTETALAGVTARYSPSFADGTSNPQFAWHAGIGVDYDVRPDLSISLGYDYASFGSFSTGYGLNNWQNDRLSIGSLKVNSVILGLTYVCG